MRWSHVKLFERWRMWLQLAASLLSDQPTAFMEETRALIARPTSRSMPLCVSWVSLMEQLICLPSLEEGQSSITLDHSPVLPKISSLYSVIGAPPSFVGLPQVNVTTGAITLGLLHSHGFMAILTQVGWGTFDLTTTSGTQALEQPQSLHALTLNW